MVAMHGGFRFLGASLGGCGYLVRALLGGSGHFMRHLFGRRRDVLRTVLGSVGNDLGIMLDSLSHGFGRRIIGGARLHCGRQQQARRDDAKIMDFHDESA
jgi:hypothetical protein